MKTRKLGRTNIEVSPLAFGGNVFGWTVDQDTSFVLLDAFVAAGFNFIDTADVYSAWVPGNQGGESETIIGNWMKLRKNRSRVVVATKVGMELGPQKKGLSKSYIINEVEESLKRLQTDYIDLYQSHTDDQDAPLAETLEAFAVLMKQGKVRSLGASNYSGERLSEALAVSDKNGYPPYQTLQPLYNLYDREVFEKTLEPVCLKNNIAVINYYSLASGFLSGKYRTEADLAKSARGQGVKRKYFNERGFKILKALDEVSKRTDHTLAQISLAWLLARPSVTVPIVSATNLDQLREIIASVSVKLDEQMIKLLDEASS